jgi:hypothetical protein
MEGAAPACACSRARSLGLGCGTRSPSRFAAKVGMLHRLIFTFLFLVAPKGSSSSSLQAAFVGCRRCWLRMLNYILCNGPVTLPEGGVQVHPGYVCSKGSNVSPSRLLAAAGGGGLI